MENNAYWRTTNIMTPPPRWSRLHTYLHDEMNGEAMEVALQLQEARPIEGTAVMIPVAAHQEAARIEHAIEQYAGQEGAAPFSILLHLNAPEGADEAEIMKTIDAVERAIKHHPELDIRYSEAEYAPKTPIGKIRKDLWDAASLLALRDGVYDQVDGECIGINHDIDTVKIGRHYIRNIQRDYRKTQMMLREERLSSGLMLPQFTQVKHAYPFATHPNIAKVMAWEDFVLRQQYPNGVYEEGIVIPLSYYAAKHGIDPTARIRETERFWGDGKTRNGIAGTPMETSPRRYIDRLGRNALADIWTDDSFGENDACRGGEMAADITQQQTEDRIMETLDSTFVAICNAAPLRMWREIGQDTAHLEARVEKLVRTRFHLAEQVLRRIVQSDTLAAFATDETIITDNIAAYIDAARQAFDEESE